MINCFLSLSRCYAIFTAEVQMAGFKKFPRTTSSISASLVLGLLLSVLFVCLRNAIYPASSPRCLLLSIILSNGLG